MATPEEIAHGAVDRLCAYDAWDAPGDYDSTAERIAEFMSAFVGIAAIRLAGVIEHGRGTPVADKQEGFEMESLAEEFERRAKAMKGTFDDEGGEQIAYEAAAAHCRRKVNA